MLLDMDSELQHLISISMDKMTSGVGASSTGHGGRKSRVMDLRKALLVAHVLQEVRCAYFDEDYKVVANTLTNFKNSTEYDKMEIKQSNDELTFSIKDVNERYTEESKTHLLESKENTTSCPASTSAFQSCVTNSDVMVSRISQVTQPLAVSVNTNHIMSCQSTLDLCVNKDNAFSCNDDDVPSICEELEVSSCCEVISSNSDEDTVECVGAAGSQDYHTATVNRMDLISGSMISAEATVTVTREQQCLSSTKQCIKHSNTTDGTFPVSVTLASVCPLPKKKRPLPKEFLNDDQAYSAPMCKTSKASITSLVESNSNQSTQVTFTNSIASAVTLESKTSTSLSTVCSVMGTTPSFNIRKSGKFQPNPKVVVQMTQACESYLPITCTQIQLEKRLGNLTARAF